MMSLHCILVEPAYCSGLDLARQASGFAWVEQSVGVVVREVVEAIGLEHCCIGSSTPRVVYSTEVVAERKVEMTGWLAGNDTEMHRTKEGV